MAKTGILLTNTGTPDAPTAKALRRYLREFLSDRRIVQLPRLVWLPILYGLVLPLRPKRSAKLYKKIWLPEGSPMRVIMKKLAKKLSIQLGSSDFAVALGMNYGTPSIQEGLIQLEQENIDKLIILPLFPQYSHTTTASTYDRVHLALKKTFPTLEPTRVFSIKHYSENNIYIEALAHSIRSYWTEHGESQHLLISFHGIPERFVRAGDPYQQECEHTAELLAKMLRLSPEKWTLCYQSQFGYDKWLKPSTQDLFQTLPQQGIKELDVVCPGFAVDCLETLEEIAVAGKESFLKAGGTRFRYLPALNDSEEQVELLVSLISQV